MPKAKPEPEIVSIAFVDLGQFKSAKEIAALPFSQIRETVEAQEAQYSKNQTIANEAAILIGKLRAGGSIRAHILPATRKFELMPADGSAPVSIKAATINQLAGRGWLAGVPKPPKPKPITLEDAQAICGTT